MSRFQVDMRWAADTASGPSWEGFCSFARSDKDELAVDTMLVDYTARGHGIEQRLPILRPEGQYVMDVRPERSQKSWRRGLSTIAADQSSALSVLMGEPVTA